MRGALGLTGGMFCAEGWAPTSPRLPGRKTSRLCTSRGHLAQLQAPGGPGRSDAALALHRFARGHLCRFAELHVTRANEFSEEEKPADAHELHMHRILPGGGGWGARGAEGAPGGGVCLCAVSPIILIVQLRKQIQSL